MKISLGFLLLTLLMLASPASAQEQLISLSFEDAPLEQAVELYREWTGRTIIKQADLSARITLKGRQLTQDEAKQAIETVLAMSGVALVPMGDKFLKVVPIGSARQEGIQLKPFDPEQKKYTEADQLISQVIPLRHVVFTDVQPLIQSLVHGYGNIIEMARINSVLLTDTSANVARIVELIDLIDQPSEKIEPRIYELKYAEAATISAKLRELVDAAKTKKGEQTIVDNNRRVIPGVIRAPPVDAPAQPESTEDAPTEMIEGEVKIVSDDRTNIIIVFSKAANFDFFDNLMKVLDIPVDPAVIVEVINLEYAKAKDISSILNEFVGAAKSSEKTKAPGSGSAEGSKTVDEIIERAVEPAGVDLNASTKSAIGRLSADTKILSDERSNSLLLMGRKADIEAIKQVIASLDVMLEQVMIEAVILSVSLGDTLDTGVQWVYNTQMKEERNDFADFKGENNIVSNAFGSVGSGLNYYGVFPQIDTKVLVRAAKTDGNARVLATPVVMTTDNTEAMITVGEERPVVSSSINSGSGSINDGYSARATYEYRNIGITLKVTPNINPQGFVVMEITQTADDPGKEIEIDGNLVPAINKREISATVAVQDRSTVVLGGLIRKDSSRSSTKIPWLGDIPLIGWLFSTRSASDDRRELVVLLTPYVITNPDQAHLEAKRRLDATDGKNTTWPRGWSESTLKNEEPLKDDWKKKKEKKKKDAVEPAVEGSDEPSLESSSAVDVDAAPVN